MNGRAVDRRIAASNPNDHCSKQNQLSRWHICAIQGEERLVQARWNGGQSVDQGARTAVTVRYLRPCANYYPRTTLQHSVPSGRPPQGLKQSQSGESEAQRALFHGFDYAGEYSARRSVGPTTATDTDIPAQRTPRRWCLDGGDCR